LSATEAPIPISPKNNHFVKSHDVDFIWHPSDSAVVYNVQVSPDSTFGGSEVDQTVAVPDTSIVVQNLLFNNYFWRIRAYRTADTTIWSPIAKFRIDTIPPVAPTLVSPVNGTTLTDTFVNFHWNSSVGVACYRIFVTRDSTGIEVADSMIVDTTGYLISRHLPDSLYYWKVQAADSAGNWSGYSEQRWFKTSIIPRPIAPVNNTTLSSHTVTFSWHGVYGASSYRVQVSIDSTFSGYEVDRSVTAPDTVTVAAGLIYNKYYWRIRTNRSSDTSIWSEIREFNISALSPDVPVLISPVNGAVVADSQPHCHWDAVSGIWYYHIEVGGDSLFTVLEDSFNIDTTGYTVDVALDDGEHWWRVRAYDNISNWSAFSSPWKFIVDKGGAGIEWQQNDRIELPTSIKLLLAWPNPSRDKSEINYQLPAAGQVAIKIYNVVGARVATLVDSFQSAGYHAASWNLRDGMGYRVANGVYMIRLTLGGLSVNSKITVIR